MIRSLLLVVLVPALLGACASAPTPYAPAPRPEAAGYREVRIETDRFRVSFRGGGDLKGDGVEELAFRRAAEVTVQQGGDWFRVVDRRTEQVGGRTGGGTSVGVSGASGSYGSGVGVGIGIDLTPDRRTYETTLEILIGRGEKPPEAAAYSARDVLARPMQR